MLEDTCLARGGECGERLRAIDWVSNPLDPVEGWPLSLQAAVRIVLSSDFPMMIHWGPELITFYNDAYAPSLGRKHPGNLGRPALEWWAEMWDQLTPIFDKVLSGQSFFVENARYTPDRDGAQREAYFTHCHSPLWDDEGRIAGIFLVVTETTRQVVAEWDLLQANATLAQQNESLRESEARLRAVVSASSEVLYSMSADWTEMRQLTGGAFLADSRPANRTWFSDYIPEDEQPRVLAAIGQAISRKALFHLEHRVRRIDGSEGWTVSRAVPLLDERGEITEWFGTASDVTARREAEVALRRLNETLEHQVAERTSELILYRNIVESARFPICAYDTHQRVAAFNRAHAAEWLRVMGRPALRGEVLPDAFPPEQGALQRAFADRALAGEEFTVEADFGSPALEMPHWELDYAPVRDETGTILGAFHHARDVTARLKAEAELVQAQEALRQSQKMEAVGQLTGGVAHDFNNLLTIIRSSVDFLQRPGLSEERRGRYLHAVSETVERASKLTGQLLAFARRQALKPEVFEIGARLSGIADMLNTVTGTRIKVVVEVPERPCFVRADLSQFETALVNMAVNARDAMDGAGQLTLRLDSRSPLPPIRGHAGSDIPFAAVSVTDTGSGIPATQLAHVFEPFFTTKEVGKGTGLGLSQVFGFAKQSGGDVDVASEPGKGTTFTLYLPEVEALQPEARADTDSLLSPAGHGESVLLVEDNLEVGQFCTQTLEDLGYRTSWVTTAEEALERLGPNGDGFEAVFSDVVMPGMGGIELARRLREKLPGLPVVLTSGYSHVLAREDDHGFELLQKPYSAAQVGRALRRVIAPQGDGASGTAGLPQAG
ncbi:PAS domain S-box-containing protein [Roseomonas rosea]|uniref:histidine kinase n=1 Tax=Muricoccus roseus TaxID=198092 RepID=A0A1M6LG72_9PROT|nr:PAS domain-containing protein [Roseomonas rosea]SHJ70187.1 PAS domain S-box-containing protein [Roseomonas rosea]